MNRYNTLLEFIRTRQSLYPSQMKAGAKIPEEDIWKLLETANYAPSHKRTEPWRYIIVSGNGLRELFNEMGRIYKAVTPVEEFKNEKLEKWNKKATVLSHVIVICMKRDEQERIPVQEEEYAVACSVQNMLLSMKSLGIIGYWGTGKVIFSEEIKEYLNLGAKDKCLGFLQLGLPKDDLPIIPRKQMSSMEEKVEFRN